MILEFSIHPVEESYFVSGKFGLEHRCSNGRLSALGVWNAKYCRVSNCLVPLEGVLQIARENSNALAFDDILTSSSQV